MFQKKQLSQMFSKVGAKELLKYNRKTPVPQPLLNKVAGMGMQFWEIYKNTFFTEYLRATASVSGGSEYPTTIQNLL